MSVSAPAAPAVQVGIERLLDEHRPLVAGRRVALVSNPASIDSRFRHAADVLFADPEIWTLTALFGPQHGFRSDLQDNMIETPHGHDARGSVPIHSLYSETREPTAEMLRDIDVLVIDLQDVGTRVYTYIYTMANCMRAAARHGVRVVVCDRPNPVGGDAVEGAALDPAYASFVGQFPIPLRHGMTIGELARLFNDTFGIGAALDVVPLDGWQRAMYFDETGLPWVMPSPNIADARQRDRLSGSACCSRARCCRKGAARPALRADRRAVDRRRTARAADERRQPARRALPPGVVRADVPQDTRNSPAAAASCT